MPQTRQPRRGSMQFWPRKRARRSYARVKAWANSDKPKLLGFAGYKVGMTHIIATDSLDNVEISSTKYFWIADTLEDYDNDKMPNSFENKFNLDKTSAEFIIKKILSSSVNNYIFIMDNTKNTLLYEVAQNFQNIKITFETNQESK